MPDIIQDTYGVIVEPADAQQVNVIQQDTTINQFLSNELDINLEVLNQTPVELQVNEGDYQIVEIVEHGTPVLLNNSFIFIDRTSYYSTDEIIAVSGLGEYYNSTLKPIFVFENDLQKMYIDGFIQIIGDDNSDPFMIKNQANEDVFKITSDEITVLKMRNDIKAPVTGGIMFFNNEVFVGLE